jgi:hypothetical protein
MAKSRGRIGSGPGPLGGIFFGNVVNCDSKDESMYCQLVKLFNVLIMVVIILYVLYFVYYYVSPYLFSGKRSR